ncbi:MAG TPA: isopentenyl phosphate kinase [Anaerolineales bacterium]|nr:isopentenyl phosphate kinase [Anaerolineales bacterium]
MIFLKLGGSLITFKDRANTARGDVLDRLAAEIADARRADPLLEILVGHGSGSFGHSAASRHRTHLGGEDWVGLAEVWRSANLLNRLVIDALIGAGLPALSFPPSASARVRDGDIVELAVEPIRRAIEVRLLPVVQGDVAFDEHSGTTILSTERVFSYMAPRLQPQRVLLAGIDRGVYLDFPRNTKVAEEIRPTDLARLAIGGSSATDVTGGMADKVRHGLALARSLPGLEVRVFSAEEPGALREALLGGTPGTLLADDAAPSAEHR